MRINLFLISLALSSAACTPAEDFDDEIGVEVPAQSSAASASAVAEARSGGARSVAISNDAIEFEYSYPAEAGQIGGLVELLDARVTQAQSEVERFAAEDRKSAEENDYPFRPHSYGAEWQVVADLPDWLSLSAEISTYTGGAHPNYGFDSLVWDKGQGEALDPTALFLSASALENALGGPFCAMLNAEREERRGQPVDIGSDELFEACPPMAELTVLLGSSNGETFDRIGLLAAPYVAGPYAEGSYEFTLPVTSAVIDAVKPEYAASFSIMATS